MACVCRVRQRGQHLHSEASFKGLSNMGLRVAKEVIGFKKRIYENSYLMIDLDDRRKVGMTGREVCEVLHFCAFQFLNFF
jgi:hypothetical protein